MMRQSLAICMAVLLILAAPLACAEEEEPAALFVKKVDNLPDGFLMGMDVSSVLAEEASGVRYRDQNGQERDLFDILAENGINLIRIRIWNDPFDEQGNGYGGGNNDVDAAIRIGRRATAAGMRVMLDFHWSDFWADPSKQMVPKAWQGMNIRQKAPALHDWTADALTRIRDAGVDVALVQLGNETNGWLCGEKIWMNIYKLMRAGAEAVREVFPGALIAVHFANPEVPENYLSWASKLDYYQLDYDVFATSYYPYWHGTPDNLKAVLLEIRQRYGKKVMVAETSYAWTLLDGDGQGNTIGAGGAYEKPYPISVQGQANEVTAVIEAMADIGGIGVCYWEGAWVPVGSDPAENAGLWEQYGSGWASSYAASYDPDDAGQYYGGSACDNQAMFDFDGRALPSLAVFRLVRDGQSAPLQIDALDDPVLYCDIHGAVSLPESVSAVMNDNSRQEIPVEWEDVDLAAIRSGGPAVYSIHGTADGREVTLSLHMIQYNYILNGSFEDSDRSMWRVIDHGSAGELYAEEKKADSRTGLWHWHFYSADADSVNFDLEQDLTGLPSGRYVYRISIQGGDAGETEVFSYVKVNGELSREEPSVITRWNDWHTPEIREIDIAEGDIVTVGIHVRCSGRGAWGKIDDAEFCSMEQ